MKILMTTDTVGGVWSYALELARNLADQPMTIGLAAMGDPLSPAQWAAVKRLRNVQVWEYPCRLEWMDDPWEDVAAAGEWLLSLKRLFKPDLVHLNNYTHGMLPWNVPVVMVAHSCVLSWWKAVHNAPAPPEWDTYRSMVRTGLQAASVVVAPTQAMLNDTKHFYGPLRHTQVIKNGCSNDSFRSGKKQPLIFAAGRLWDVAKNIGALNTIADQLAWPVYVAGSTKHPGGGGAAEYPHVHALGLLNAQEMHTWLAQAMIYALPARYEPFGLSILEAALSGCALVLGDIPSLRELWSGVALFVDPNDPVRLHHELAALISQPQRCKSLGYQTHQRALEYSSYRMATRYTMLYRTLLQAKTWSCQSFRTQLGSV